VVPERVPAISSQATWVSPCCPPRIKRHPHQAGLGHRHLRDLMRLKPLPMSPMEAAKTSMPYFSGSSPLASGEVPLLTVQSTPIPVTLEPCFSREDNWRSSSQFPILICNPPIKANRVVRSATMRPTPPR